MLATIGLVRLRSAFLDEENFAIVLACILFFFAVHSVFESQARYHMPVTGFLVMVAGCAFLCRRQPPRLIGSFLRLVYPEREPARLSDRSKAELRRVAGKF